MVKYLGKQSLFLAKFNICEYRWYSFSNISSKMVKCADFLVVQKTKGVKIKTFANNDHSQWGVSRKSKFDDVVETPPNFKILITNVKK